MQDNLWLFYDALAVLAVLLSAYHGFRQGFVRTLISFVGSLLALSLAVSLSAPISQMLYDRFIEARLVNYVEERLALTPESTQKTLQLLEEVSGNTQALVESISESQIMSYFEGILSQVTPQRPPRDTPGSYSAFLEALQSGKSAPQAITDVVVAPLALPAIRLVTGLTLFALLMLLVRICSGLLGEIANKLPLVSTLNRLMGGAVGVAWGVMWLYIVVMLLMAVVTTFGDFKFLNAQALAEAKLLSHIAGLAPPLL